MYYCGAAILLVGLVGAAVVYVVAGDAEADAAAELASGRMYQHNLELMGGKFAVFAAEFDQWFASLWHGRPLALTVAVLAIAIALVFFWIGHLMSAPEPNEMETRSQD